MFKKLPIIYQIIHLFNLFSEKQVIHAFTALTLSQLDEEWVQCLKTSVLYKDNAMVMDFNPLPLSRKGKSHGAVLWMEYHLTADISVSTGLMQISNEKVLLQSNFIISPSLLGLQCWKMSLSWPCLIYIVLFIKLFEYYVNRASRAMFIYLWEDS